MADAVARRHAVAHSTRVARRGAVRRRRYRPSNSCAPLPSIPAPTQHAVPSPLRPSPPKPTPDMCLRLYTPTPRLRLRLLGLPHGCLHTRPHPCTRLRLHPRVPIVCLWLYAYAYAVVAAPLPPPPPPPPPPPRPRRPPAAAEPPHHRFHRRHRRLRGRLPRHRLPRTDPVPMLKMPMLATIPRPRGFLFLPCAAQSWLQPHQRRVGCRVLCLLKNPIPPQSK